VQLVTRVERELEVLVGERIGRRRDVELSDRVRIAPDLGQQPLGNLAAGFGPLKHGRGATRGRLGQIRRTNNPALLQTGGVGRLRVVIHLATACAVLGLAVAVGRWLRDPEPGGPLVALVALAALIGLCAHRLYRVSNVARWSPLAVTGGRNRSHEGLARAEPPPPPRSPPPPLWMTADLLDLNHANAVELQTLPGVGKVTAERIVQERERRPFGSVDDLARVGGLGPARIRAIAERVRTS
jgi:hypothetical protein